MTVRAFFEAAKVEGVQSPYDTIHLKILYPAQIPENQLEKSIGIEPANPENAPFPVVIFFNGFNCDAQQYQWLAVKLAERGLVVVLFNWITKNLPGVISLTPGVDFEKMKPTIYPTAPTASALPALLAKLEQLQNQGILAGMLDLQRIILGGHSAGGMVSIQNADPRFFPGVAASPQVLAVLGKVLAEKDKAEQHLIASGLTYTIIRPGGLKSEPATGNGILTEDPQIIGSINRADVAQLVVRCLNSQRANNKILSAIDRNMLFGQREFAEFSLG